MAQLRFDGRVVVVTGAGGGLGRAYAHFFSSRGANVVVNDLGGSLQGGGTSSRAADQVVAEIIANGGKAVPNYDSVENGATIIATAIEKFGRIDVLVNNAGLLRDVSFRNMKDSDWDLVMQVHLHGAYKCCAAAWPYFRRQKYGRIINTTSGAGLYGNFGQANYSAAKLSLVGLTQVLAKEGYSDNILVNAVAPIAASRMTETVMSPEMLRLIDPQFVVAAAAVLVHETNHAETGGIFEVGGGSVRKLRWERSPGVAFGTRTPVDLSDVVRSWADVNDYRGPVEHPVEHVKLHPSSATSVARGREEETLSPIFRGQIALISGAANKRGSTNAYALARLGAEVIAVDNSDKVNETVDDIRKNGGQATACIGAASLAAVLKRLDRLDIVIATSTAPESCRVDNNSEDTWSRIVASSFESVYKIIRTAWPFLLRNSRGKVVIEINPIGLYGESGQAAYSSSALGLLGLARTLGIEGTKKRIDVNTIACHDEGAYENSVALITALCSDKLPKPFSGGLYEVDAGRIASVRWQASGGWVFGNQRPLTPEEVIQKFPAIVGFDDGKATYPSRVEDGTERVFGNHAQAGAPGPKL